MKLLVIGWMLLMGISSCGCQKDDREDPVDGVQPKDVVKTNPAKVYMHVMPWFNSKDHSGYWGIHWKMGNKNPETILPNGQREIASHYYPLIGPYDSGDPDVIDYQLLLMKYAGVDGVLIDWYGSYNILDYGANLINSNAIVAGVKRVGLEFGIIYEDNVANEAARRTTDTEIEAAKKDFNYVREHYFSSDRYIQIEDKPLLMTFGPRYFTSPAQWTEILSVLSKKPAFFPLWDHTHRTGTSNSTGEYSWVDFDPTLSKLDHFYQATNHGLSMGSAYPGFHDFYKQGGWGDSYGFVDLTDGETLKQTLQKAKSSQVPYLQLVTWNDYGEGTMIEPTVEFQYQFVDILQEFTGVTYRQSELETIANYYKKRKEYKTNPEAQKTLDLIFNALIQLDVSKANELLHNL